MRFLVIFFSETSLLPSLLCSASLEVLEGLGVNMASRPPFIMASGLFLALSFACVSAMTPSNGVEFLFPTQGATLHYNDYVQVQYTSEFSAPFLYTFCRAASGSVSRKFSSSIESLLDTGTAKWEPYDAHTSW